MLKKIKEKTGSFRGLFETQCCTSMGKAATTETCSRSPYFSKIPPDISKFLPSQSRYLESLLKCQKESNNDSLKDIVQLQSPNIWWELYAFSLLGYFFTLAFSFLVFSFSSLSSSDLQHFFLKTVIVITLYNAVSTAVQLILHTSASMNPDLTMFISCLKFLKELPIACRIISRQEHKILS